MQRKEADDGDDAVPEEISSRLDSVTSESLRVCRLSFVTRIVCDNEARQTFAAVFGAGKFCGYTTESVTHGQCDTRPTVTFPSTEHHHHLSVTHGQCDARPTVTFPSTEHHHHLSGTKLYCLSTRVSTCPELLHESGMDGSQIILLLSK